MAANPAVSAPVKPSLTLKRRLNAPPAKVFAAWTDPAQLVRWFGPSETVEGSVKAEMDVRAGGRFRASFTGCMGENREYHEVGGVYREVVAPERLVFTYSSEGGRIVDRETLVTVTFADRGGRTLLTLRHSGLPTEQARALHDGGWVRCLDRFTTTLPEG